MWMNTPPTRLSKCSSPFLNESMWGGGEHSSRHPNLKFSTSTFLEVSVPTVWKCTLKPPQISADSSWSFWDGLNGNNSYSALHFPFIAKQYLAKLCSPAGRDSVARQQLTTLQIRSRREQLWVESGRLQCECVYSISVSIPPVYPLLMMFFYFHPPSVMYPFHDDDDVFKNLSLLSKHKSLHRDDSKSRKR